LVPPEGAATLKINFFQREQRSLFGEILDWMLTPLLIVWPVTLGLTWVVAQGLANRPYDDALQADARALSQLVQTSGNRVTFALPNQARDLLRADERDVVLYQVLGGRGELLSGERDMPLPDPDTVPSLGEVYMRDQTWRDSDFRVAYVWVGVALPHAQPALIQVAETRGKRSELAAEIIKGVMLPQFAVLPLLVVLVWLALGRGIRPLHQLEDRIRAREPDDLSPLDARVVPLEVAPLVVSVNDLLGRLQHSIRTHKRFIADAAHQLKTPLAGLRMQAELALREGTAPDELRQSLKQIGRSSVRATHTVNQLLSLARTEGQVAGLTTERCDLVDLVQEALADALPRALERGHDLGYEGAAAGSRGVAVQANRTLMQELLRNLIDNALHYTPSTPEQPGVITARVLADHFGGVVIAQVEDNGPGIAESDRKLIFQPFYRVLGQVAEGSGLGLAIVQEIAQRHGAQIGVDDARPGARPPGALFTLRLPSLSDPQLEPDPTEPDASSGHTPPPLA
jgi:two-component system, OmpR family, sensor histidine kinase TctE